MKRSVASVVLLGAFLVLLPGGPGCREDKLQEQKYGGKNGAWINAQRFVKKKLTSPGVADFGGQGPDECVTDFGKGKYRVTGWVDTQDRSGANVRRNFALVIEYTGKTKWRVIEGPVIH